MFTPDAWKALLSLVISLFINAYPNLKLFNYSDGEQWKDIMPSLIIALVMGAIVYSFNYLNISAGLTLMLQTIVGELYTLA